MLLCAVCAILKRHSKVKCMCFGWNLFAFSSNVWLPDAKSQLIGKDPMLGKTEGRRRREQQRMRRLGGITGPGDSEGQGSLMCCSPCGCRQWTWINNWTTTKADEEEEWLFCWKILLNNYSVPGKILGTKDRPGNHESNFLPSWNSHSSGNLQSWNI